jgi:hypothetical protein
MKKASVILMALLAIVVYACSKKSNTADTTDTSGTGTTGGTTTITYTGTGSVTKGLGTTTQSAFYSCMGGRVTSLGTITSTDGKSWIVPGDIANFSLAKLPDLFNNCNGKSPANISAVDLASIPTTVIDADGEVITGYVHGDNYYEIYINGKLLGVDPVPYTPFNSSYVKFKAKRPIKYAIKLIDWEENLGIGSEANGSNAFYPGDGGFIAKFSDGTVTSSAWKVQTFYIAPITNPNCVTESGLTRTSAGCALPTSAAAAYALHWAVPANWFATDYDASAWPAASIFAEATVSPKEAYTNFSAQFMGAQWIWSSNLILDNLVLMRFTGN